MINTAHWIAAARARETERPDRLFNDPYAAILAGEKGKAVLALSEQASGMENPFLPVRTRCFDDLLMEAVNSRHQIVLLGAGLDVRAYRLPLPPEAYLFELDRAEVLEEKERTLLALNAQPSCRRRPVSVDLAGPWRDDLTAAGFEPAAASIWIAEGLFYYLSEPQVRSLLEAARSLSAPDSLFVADLFGTGILQQAQLQSYLRRLEKERLPAPFCTDEPAALLTDCGWEPTRIISPGQPGADYGRLSQRNAGGAAAAAPDVDRAYFICATARG